MAREEGHAPALGLLTVDPRLERQSAGVSRYNEVAVPDSQVRSENRRRTRVATVLAILTTIILLRNLALESPIMAGDEYKYFAAAQTFPRTAERFISDPYLPRINSPVFAAYGRALFSLSDRPELLLKALNAVCFALTTVLFLRLAKTLAGVDASLAAAAVFLLLPISSYTAYFMPETTYAFLFALLTWSVVAFLPTQVFGGAVLSGLLVGTMLLVKPHALAVFLAVLLTFGAQFISPRAFRPASRTLLTGIAVFISSTYVTLVGLNAVLSGQLQLHPLTFVGEFYRPFLFQGPVRISWLGRARELPGILCGHLIVFGAVLAPAAALGAGLLRGLYVKHSSPVGADSIRDRRLFALICFTALVTLVTVGMTTNFTAQIAETDPAQHLRLYGRYYTFVFPLYLVLYFAFGGNDKRLPVSDTWIRAGAVAGCVTAALLYYLQGKRNIYWFDYPEAFAFSGWRGRPRAGFAGIAAAISSQAAITVALISYALMLWRGRRALFLYPLLLLMVFSLGNIEVTAWQHAYSVNNATLRADARAMKQLIPSGELDRGLVVGSEWNGPLAYSLFNLGSSARVLVRDAGSVITEADIPAGARWVLLIGRYQAAFPATISVRTPQVALIRVNAGMAASH
jgi:phosphoglycerol transferase